MAMNKQRNQPSVRPQVRFTPLQVAHLESVFPEFVGTAETSNEELRFRAGQRSIIQYVKERQTQED